MIRFPAIKRNPVMRIALLLGVAMTLSACSGDSDLREWVAQEKAKKGAPIPPLPVIKTFETFTYNDQGQRDPFGASAAETQAAQAVQPDPNWVKQPLEMFALDSLKMVGTVGGGASMEVLVKDPSGVIHRVHRNEHMGQNFGRVTAVSEDHIDLVELVPNGNGGWMERSASIALGEK